MADPSSGSDAASGSDPAGPYQTSMEERFISPFTPFLNHIAFVEQGPPIERWCEQRRIYYALCTHITNFNRCNNPDNPTGICNRAVCRYPPEYVTYAEYLCPACQRRGRPELPLTEIDLIRSNNEWRARANSSWEIFFQLVSEAQQDGNLALQELEDPEELFEDPDILGQEILAELAAAEMDDLRGETVFEGDSEDEGEDEDEDDDEDDNSGGASSSPPALPPLPRDHNHIEWAPDVGYPGDSEGWVARLQRGYSAAPRAQWFARIAWHNATARAQGIIQEVYYVPDNATDDTGLLVRPDRILVGATCAVCLMDFGEDEDVRRLPCTHLFHYECILRWLFNGNCPFCRYMYVLRGIPRFVDEDGPNSSSSLSSLGETPSPPHFPPGQPLPPGVPHIGGIPLIPGGVLGGQYPGGQQPGGQQPGGRQQGGGNQG